MVKKNKKATINLSNKYTNCFQYAIIPALNQKLISKN